MSPARWSPLAGLELEEILYYIAFEAGRPGVAEKLNRQIQELADRLAQYPALGEARPELGRGLRVFSFKRWVIVYRPFEDGIDVVGFVDTAREFNDFFGGR